jgi:hypothetical protein
MDLGGLSDLDESDGDDAPQTGLPRGASGGFTLHSGPVLDDASDVSDDSFGFGEALAELRGTATAAQAQPAASESASTTAPPALLSPQSGSSAQAFEASPFLGSCSSAASSVPSSGERGRSSSANRSNAAAAAVGGDILRRLQQARSGSTPSDDRAAPHPEPGSAPGGRAAAVALAAAAPEGPRESAVPSSTSPPRPTVSGSAASTTFGARTTAPMGEPAPREEASATEEFD